MHPPALLVESLSKRYGRIQALRPMDLEVPRGSVFALLGSNGAGKSTFMKAVLSLVRPDSGRALLLGVDSRDPGSRMPVRYLPEIIRFPGRLNPALLHRHLCRVRGEGRREDLVERLEELHCPELIERRFSDMSRGQVQRCGIALAFAGSPSILFLDEPSNGLDPEARIILRAMVRSEAAKGATVVINSHLLGEVEAVCGMAAFLRTGSIVASGELDSLVRLTGKAWVATTAPAGMVSHLAAQGFEAVQSGAGVEAGLPGDDGFRRLTAAVAASGLPFTSVETRRESLEDLFLRLASEVSR